MAVMALLMLISTAVPASAQPGSDDDDDDNRGRRRSVLFASFGMVGITPSQTARLNLTPLCPTASDNGPSNPLTVRMLFYDEEGNVLAESSEELLPGKPVSLNLDGASFTAPRTPIRAALLLPAVQAGPPVPLPVVAFVPPNPCVIPLTTVGDEITVILRPAPAAPARDSFFDIFVDLNLEVFNTATGETAFVLDDPLVAVGQPPRSRDRDDDEDD
jgi:hypothetical protein